MRGCVLLRIHIYQEQRGGVVCWQGLSLDRVVDEGLFGDVASWEQAGIPRPSLDLTG